MRGSKGGFWDRLRFRFRKRKQYRIKKEKEIENKIIDSEKKKKLKIKKQEIDNFNYLLNKKKREVTPIKTKKKTKKGVSKKNEIINTEQNNKTKKQISPKIQKKKTSEIIDKPVYKKKKGINNKNQTIIKLNEKTSKLIIELNKLISDDKEKINKISHEIGELKSDLENSKTIKEVEDIEQKLIELKRKLIELIEQYTKLKDGSFSKIKNEKIENIIEDIKKIDQNFNFYEIVDTIKPNLDYYNEMSNCAVSTVNMIYTSSYQKDIIDYKNNTEDNINNKFSDVKDLSDRLNNELNKHKNIINEFNALISKISPKKIVSVQNNFLETLLHNTGCLIGTFLSIPFLKKPKNVPLFAFGLFTINNSIRNMRRVTTTENISYIPSDDYAKQIIRYKNSFGFVDYMISDSLYQITELKEEYKINFSGFHNTEEFNKNLKRIENIEYKIQKQAKEIKELKSKYENTLNKNYEKVLSIKKK